MTDTEPPRDHTPAQAGTQCPKLFKDQIKKRTAERMANKKENSANTLSYDQTPPPKLYYGLPELPVLSEDTVIAAGITLDRRKAVMHFEKLWLSHITDIQIRNFVFAYFDNIVPNRFFIMPPSTTGKHHPRELHRPGGLVIHTFRALHFFASIRKGCKIDMDLSSYFWAALALHDTEKNGKGWSEKDGKGSLHPQRAAEKVIRVASGHLQPSKIELLASMILNHLGPYTDNVPVKVPPPINMHLQPWKWEEFSNRQFTMYLCDLMAASKTTLTAYDDMIADWLTVPEKETE